MSVNEANHAIYMRASIVAEYAAASELFPAERAILDRYRADYAGRRVLDIGVGGGRTVTALAPHAASYLGIDYSEGMVRSSAGRYPQFQFRHADARHLPDLAGGSFDFVMFSYNGIDYVDHRGRMQILAEIFRILTPGGLFIFSSHNLDHLTGKSSFIRRKIRSVRSLRPLAHPREAIASLVECTRCLISHLQRARLEEHTADYAILNDPAHNFRLLHYYIGGHAQMRQLAAAGFDGSIEIFDANGAPTEPGSDPVFIYYAARKP